MELSMVVKVWFLLLSSFFLPYCQQSQTVFGKVGSVASETVVTELLKSKCMPILFYGLEVCPLFGA